MKIGGYKDNQNTSDIDLSPIVQDTSKQEITNVKDAPETIVEKAEIQDTSIEIEETGKFDKPEINESVEDTDKNKSSLNAGGDPAPAAEPVVVPEVVVNEPVEISEELHLKYLSEKLGREVKSFDELTKAESNPLDSDPYLKELAAWREKTGRPIEDWIKFQKDYTKVSDADVAREFLQLQYPELTPDEVQFELDRKYLSSEDDFKDDATLKNLELKKLASQGRKELSKLISDLGNPNPVNLTPEVQKDLDLAKQYKALVQQNEVSNTEYNKNIVAKASELKSIKLELADGISLDYKLPVGSEKSLVNTIQNAPTWVNEDGSWNHQTIVRDAAIAANFESMLKLAYEQGKNSGTDEVIREAKNTTLGNRVSNDSALTTTSKGAQIEGLDRYLGNKGMKIIRGK